MNIDLKKLREDAESPFLRHLDGSMFINPQTIIELCDMIEKMKCCGNCKHEAETGICELDYKDEVCEWNIGLSKWEPK
jgi:hypothetical protein